MKKTIENNTNSIVSMLKKAAADGRKTLKKKALFGAAKISHEKKVAVERKAKAVVASMKSVAKRKANMTVEELTAWRKKQSEASVKSHKARLAAMTEDQLAAYKAERNAKAKVWREARKANFAVVNTADAVIELSEVSSAVTA